MSKYKATGKVYRFEELYSSLDPDFKRVVDEIIDNNGNGCYLLRLLRLKTTNIQTPSKLLDVLLEKYDRDNHYFNINGHHLNITLEDVLYITGLPINGNAVISSTSRDVDAFSRVFTSPVVGKLHVRDLERIARDTSKTNEERLIALLMLVIVCFISPVCEDYMVHDYLVQFVENLDQVNSYSWGAAFLASLYTGIEKTKRNVDGNCWPLLAFFCIRIPNLCTTLNFQINLENENAPLLNKCMMPMKRFSTNKRFECSYAVNQVLDSLKYEDIIWHPYNEHMLDVHMRLNHLPFVTYLAPVVYMYSVAHHRSLSHLRQFKGLEEFVGKSFRWTGHKITLKQNRGDMNQDLTIIYRKWLDLWNSREPVDAHIKRFLNRRTETAPANTEDMEDKEDNSHHHDNQDSEDSPPNNNSFNNDDFFNTPDHRHHGVEGSRQSPDLSENTLEVVNSIFALPKTRVRRSLSALIKEQERAPDYTLDDFSPRSVP